NDSGSGTVSFAIEMPLIDDKVKPDNASTLSADLGAVYSNVQFTTTVNTTGSPVPWGTGVLQVTGTAANQAALERLRVSCVYWATGGVEYYQNLTPVTYDEMNPNREGVIGETVPRPDANLCEITWTLKRDGTCTIRVRIALDLGNVSPSQIAAISAIFDGLKALSEISYRLADMGTYVDMTFDAASLDALNGAKLEKISYQLADGTEYVQTYSEPLALADINATENTQSGGDDGGSWGCSTGGFSIVAAALALALAAKRRR
ncbi:MAG: hypothetical protein LBR38_05100, partial [Synergistaceae bacterium]|nr:hypothetical protein [Synergistaceae bacterium]